MSKKTDKLEIALTALAENNIGKSIPTNLPDWMICKGILAGSIIEGAERLGGKNSKTDVIVRLQNSAAIKISAKLRNADYFGNWYGHERIIKEFGIETFEKLTKTVTDWAKDWVKKDTADLFVGVCVSFGARKGDTCFEFTDVFDKEDVLLISKGDGEGDEVANSLFVSNKVPKEFEGLVDSLQEINIDNVEKAVTKFKIICRPVNPITNDTNRSKCIYTMFKPYKRLEERTEITTLSELMKLGEFVPVHWSVSYKMNTNKLLDILEDCYNIYIPRKRKKK